MVTAVTWIVPGMVRRPGGGACRAAERRETILRGAAEVFAQAGYRAAKVSDVRPGR